MIIPDWKGILAILAIAGLFSVFFLVQYDAIKGGRRK
jgi:hypothetical protein